MATKAKKMARACAASPGDAWNMLPGEAQQKFVTWSIRLRHKRRMVDMQASNPKQWGMQVVLFMETFADGAKYHQYDDHLQDIRDAPYFKKLMSQHHLYIQHKREHWDKINIWDVL